MVNTNLKSRFCQDKKTPNELITTSAIFPSGVVWRRPIQPHIATSSRSELRLEDLCKAALPGDAEEPRRREGAPLAFFACSHMRAPSRGQVIRGAEKLRHSPNLVSARTAQVAAGTVARTGVNRPRLSPTATLRQRERARGGFSKAGRI